LINRVVYTRSACGPCTLDRLHAVITRKGAGVLRAQEYLRVCVDARWVYQSARSGTCKRAISARHTTACNQYKRGRRERQCACIQVPSGRQSLKLCPWSASLPCMAESSHGRGRSTVLNASLMHSAFLHMKFTIMQVQSRPVDARTHALTGPSKLRLPVRSLRRPQCTCKWSS
jgi:hypothetical protein